jgi:probable F420-dependent oxidoreductase
VGDHFYWGVSPLSALMAAADATTTLRIGSYVFNNDLRHPAVLAKEVATLDLLSNGRFECGLGAGWYGPEYAQAGLSFTSPAERRGRLAEAIRIIKGLCGEEPVSLAGPHYTLAGLAGLPKPVQRPHPPLLVGGGGRHMLTLAAQEADIVGLIPPMRESRLDWGAGSLTAMERRVDWVRQAAGERFESLELNILVFDLAVADDQERGAAEIAPRWKDSPDAHTTAATLLDTTCALVGTVDQIVEEIQRWRERLGVSYVVVNGAHNLWAFAPVVERLAGT